MDFNKLIDNHLARENKPKSIGRYYPSEIAGCMRKTYFSYKNPKQTDAKLNRIFEAGNMLHPSYQAWSYHNLIKDFNENVQKENIQIYPCAFLHNLDREKNPEIELIRSELPIEIKEKDFIISGRIDNLVLVKIDNKLALVEVKSIKFLPKEYRKEHETQLQLYMKALGIHEGIILYIQKDNLETRTFNIKFSKKQADKIIERFQELHKALTKDKLPEAEAKQDKDKSWMCDYCNYAEECGGK